LAPAAIALGGLTAVALVAFLTLRAGDRSRRRAALA
jgi:hypothetical protein